MPIDILNYCRYLIRFWLLLTSLEFCKKCVDDHRPIHRSCLFANVFWRLFFTLFYFWLSLFKLDSKGFKQECIVLKLLLLVINVQNCFRTGKWVCEVLGNHLLQVIYWNSAIHLKSFAYWSRPSLVLFSNDIDVELTLRLGKLQSEL